MNMKPQPSHIISLVPIIIALGFLLGVFSVSLTEFNTVILSLATIGSAILYAIAIFYVNSLQDNLWQGYVHLATSLALLTTGLANALYVIIGVSIIVSFIKYILSDRQDNQRNIAIKNAFGWIGLSGITVIIEFLIYTIIFKQSLPFTTLTIESLLPVVITLAIGNAVSVFAGATITQQPALQSIRKTVEQSPPLFEVILIFVTAIIAVVLYQVNELTFIVIVVFTVAQVLYGHNANKLKHESSVRLHELTTLNAIAQAISINIELDDVLSSIYTEVNQLVDADTIFVAFYDDDSDTISYPLVKKTWSKPHMA